MPDWYTSTRVVPVVSLALCCLLAGCAALELMHRAEFTWMLGRPPADWSDPQVRAYSRAQSLFALGDEKRGGEAMRAVAEMRPSGDVTASAWWQYAQFGIHFEKHAQRARYGRKALEAAPDDSPKLGMYYRLLARELAKLGEFLELTETTQRTAGRTADRKVRAGVVCMGMDALTGAGHAAEAIKLYEHFAKRYPELRERDGARLDLAQALIQLEREQEARRILDDLVDSPSTVVREWAQLELKRLSEGTGP